MMEGKSAVRLFSSPAKRRTKTGFTLPEIMIILLIMALLIAIAMPNFMKAQRRVERITCLANLRQMDEAVERYAVSKKKPLGASVYFTDIIPAFLKMEPQCPSHGTYYLNTVGADPTCSMEVSLNHKLP